MTHNEERAHWIKEGAIGLGVGVLYGVTNVCVGHPFDTIKTKMQAQAGFENTNMFQTFVRTLKTQGLRGFYRYTYLDSPTWRHELPGSGGVQGRVIMSGMVASTARAFIETPLEYAKVKGQTQQRWQLRALYTGFGVTWFRTMGLMTTYFVLVDSGRRHFPEHFKRPLLGPFLTSGIAATLAWWVVWPLEYMKCQVQTGYGQNLSVVQRMKLTIQERGGFFALYRGLLPGSIRSFIANGTSMMVMSLAQKKVTEWGLRD